MTFGALVVNLAFFRPLWSMMPTDQDKPLLMLRTVGGETPLAPEESVAWMRMS